jgi:phenylpyruvate tautomerase PptA (4-oxalocrotonate tautomerase family)
MPIVHIRSLALPNAIDMPSLLNKLANAFAQQAKIQLEHISIEWNYIQPGHYFVNQQVHHQQQANQPPLMVELLIPDVHSDKRQQQLISVLAKVIHQHSHIALDNIFVSLRLAQSGSIFDNGRIVTWPKKG